MSARFEPGEVVDVHIKGARVVRYETPDYDPDCLVVTLPNGADETRLPMPSWNVTVERAAPPEWPPQPGDVWRDPTGVKWFAAEPLTGEEEPLMLPAAAWLGCHASEALADHGPFELLYREGWTPPPTTDDAGGAQHTQRSGWVGEAGECGAECTCGVTFDGFDTLAEAAAMLAEHIADPDRKGTEAAPDWVPGSGAAI